VPSKHPL